MEIAPPISPGYNTIFPYFQSLSLVTVCNIQFTYGAVGAKRILVEPNVSLKSLPEQLIAVVQFFQEWIFKCALKWHA